MDLDKAIENRKSVRKFSSKKPDWRDILECIDSMRHIPAAGGNFVLKFILVNDKDMIGKIAEAAQQDFIQQAHYLVVVCSDNLRHVNAFGERGKIYARHEAGAAIQNFLLKIQQKKLSACWVGHFVDEQVKRELKIPGDIEAVIPIGYEFKKEKVSKKISLDRVLYFEKYGNKKMKNPKKINV